VPRPFGTSAVLGIRASVETILCAVDGSEGAEQVVRVAQRLAAALDARLILANVAPPTEAPGVSAALAGQERLREEERADSRRLLEDLAARLDASEVELRTEIGPPADRILELCAQESATLVVMGSRGRGDVTSALLGSVAHRVASSASCPVVIVPPGADTRAFT
jgi:nucleotide-binding universal stress UspA family protein